MFLMSEVPLYRRLLYSQHDNKALSGSHPISQDKACYRAESTREPLQGYLAHKKHPPPRTLQ